MPRRRKSQLPESDDPRAERVAVFARTKMCKFFILGACAKGSECRYAHAKEELQGLPDLARTKLCKALINTGQCDDPTCTYAHTKEQLRCTPVPDAAPKRPQRSPGASPVADPQLPRQLPPTQPAHQVSPQQGLPNQPRQPIDVSKDPLSSYASILQQMQSNASLLQQMSKDPVMMQNYAQLLQQVGKAAQAHAMEATRLQAMALQLQTGAVGSPLAGAHAGAASLAGSYNWLGSPAGGNQLGGQLGCQFAAAGAAQGENLPPEPWPSHHEAATAPAECLDVSSPHLQPHSVLGGQASPNDRQDNNPQNLAATMSRVLGNEPVQIRTETLRSMSSNSLSRMVMPEGDDENAGDDEKLRDLVSPQHASSHDMGVSLIDQVSGSGFGALSKRPGFVDEFDGGAITVKNTFLDFGPVSACAPLRAVRTAGGRLDLLGSTS